MTTLNFPLFLYLFMMALILAAGFSTATTTITVSSDSSTQWSADGSTWNSAVACWVHPSWPSISDATWIWRTYETNVVDEYNTVPEGGWYFQRQFSLPDCASNIHGTLQITADNAYTVSLNNNAIGGDGAMNKNGPDNQEWSTVENYNIDHKLQAGSNELSIRAMNWFYLPPYDTSHGNPAGLIYKATISYDLPDSDGDGVLDCEGVF
jgi:hypothetical protein